MQRNEEQIVPQKENSVTKAWEEFFKIRYSTIKLQKDIGSDVEVYVRLKEYF